MSRLLARLAPPVFMIVTVAVMWSWIAHRCIDGLARAVQ